MAKHSAEKDAEYADKSKAACVHLQRYEDSYEAHEDFIDIERKCTNFVFGQQWSPEDLKRCADDKKPTLTINLTLRTVNAIYGEYSSMVADITTKSRGKKANDASHILNKIIAQVLYDNEYSAKEASLFLDGITSGRGFISARLSNVNDPLGEIELFLEDNLQVVLSKDAKDYDPDSWPEIFYVEWKTREELEAEYDKETVETLDFSVRGNGKDLQSAYMRFGHTIGGEENNILPSDAGSIEFEEAQLITREFWEFRDAYVFVDKVTTDTETVPVEELEEELQDGESVQQYAERLAESNGLDLYKTRRKFVKVAVFCGEVLIDEYWSPYDHFSTVPFFAYHSKGRTMGVVENLISPQEQVNKSESQELHIVNSTTNGGWIVQENSLVNMDEEDLATNGSKTGLVIVHRRGYDKPEKISPNSVPTGITNIGAKAANNLLGVSGVNEGMLGYTGANIAGKTVVEKKNSGQSQLQRVFDNLEITRKILARNIVAIIQTMFTEPRVLRYTVDGEDKTQEVAYNQVNAAGQIINDVSLGKYDIVVTTRPAQDTVDDYEFTEVLQMREIGVQIPDWVLVEKSHLSNKDEIASFMKRAAGVEMSPEEQQIAQLTNQLKLVDMQLELQKKQSEVAKNNSQARLNDANAQDVLVGQNQRHVLGLLASSQEAERGNELRRELAQLSSDTTLVKSQQDANVKRELQSQQLGSHFDLQLLSHQLEQLEPQSTEPTPELGVTNANQSGN